MVIHVIRRSRGAGVVAEVLDGHRPALWVSDLYGAQRGHAEGWQICLAHQLRDCTYAIEAGVEPSGSPASNQAVRRTTPCSPRA